MSREKKEKLVFKEKTVWEDKWREKDYWFDKASKEKASKEVASMDRNQEKASKENDWPVCL